MTICISIWYFEYPRYQLRLTINSGIKNNIERVALGDSVRSSMSPLPSETSEHTKNKKKIENLWKQSQGQTANEEILWRKSMKIQ